ncbi:delta(14)-sterol reductase LBR [Caerostris darwini]|uniref:Delta(14)-sterol reductase LBR n=1 Tax=Caerostris darwini TaxID=1538125 RepID=A0AAV4M2R7_9ARAC|nr:delta(14)-sterol reductase LBR [Caerostris darwini]
MSSKSKKESFKKGDRVSARWAGSNVYYDAKIMDVTSRTYRVQFDDGSVSSVRFSEVKKLLDKEPSPKATKSKSRSRSRSTGRTTRSRSRSPARREKRAVAAKNEKKSNAKEDKKKVESSDSNSVPKNEVEVISKPILTRERVGLLKQDVSEIVRRSPVVLVNSFAKETRTTLEKYESTSERSSERLRSARIAAILTTEKFSDTTDSKSTTQNTKSATKKKYSDDEDEEEEEEEVVVVSSKLSKAKKTFYFIATLLRIIFIPTILLFLVFSCTKRQCTILDIPQFYSRWSDVGNSVKYPFAGIFIFHMLQCILSFIPLGKKVMGFITETNKNPLEYRLNGLLILLLNIVVFGICSYLEVYMNWGYDRFRGFALSAALYCAAWALGLHVYALWKGNGIATSKIPILGKFYNGSYINPVLFGKLDLKTSFIRTGLMGVVLLNLSIILKLFLMKGYITIPLALTSGMQIFYVLDFFAREEKMLSTATYTSDTFGYSFILTTSFLVPFGLSLQNIYHFNFDAKSSVIPHYCSAALVFIFFLGYFIYFTSTNLKHNFRRNPFSPNLANVISIPTSKKKRLIASGLWGKVRHPNYLGLLIMALAWTGACGITHAVPYGPFVLLVCGLVIRIFRIEAECKEKYGPAWNNYTEKVRSRLIPYIF